MKEEEKSNDAPRPKKKRGGRKLGSKNKKNLFQQHLDELKDAKAKYEAQIHHIDKKTGTKYDKFNRPLGDFYGETPLEFMLAVMYDPKQPTAFRFQAAKESAPYRHPKLASIEVKSKNLTVTAQRGKQGDALTASEAAQVYKELLDG